MRWDRGHDSPYLEDRRGMSAPGRGIGLGGLALLGPLLGRFGWKGLLIVGAIILAFQYFTCPAGDGGQQAVVDTPGEESSEDELIQFVGYVFDDVQQSYDKDFTAMGMTYAPARIVVYRQAVSSACGTAPSSVGPFYCPNDDQVYVDLSF